MTKQEQITHIDEQLHAVIAELWVPALEGDGELLSARDRLVNVTKKFEEFVEEHVLWPKT